MVIPPIKPFGRSLCDFELLKPAEQNLLEACRIGVFAKISEQRPEQANEQNIVRASFLRFLALRRCKEKLETGKSRHSGKSAKCRDPPNTTDNCVNPRRGRYRAIAPRNP